VAHLEIREIGMDRGGDVARERPGRRCPDEEIFPISAAHWKAHEHGLVRDALIALVHLHLADADRAARAPGHGIVCAIDQVLVVALF